MTPGHRPSHDSVVTRCAGGGEGTRPSPVLSLLPVPRSTSGHRHSARREACGPLEAALTATMRVLEPCAQHSRSRGDRRHPVQVLSLRGGAKGTGSWAHTAAQPIATPGYDPGQGGASAPPARTNQRAAPPARSGTKGGTALCRVCKASALGAGPCILYRMLLYAWFCFVLF